MRGKNKGLKKHQEDFKRHWHQVFNNLAAKTADISPAELRLALRILQSSYRKGRLAVRITDEYLGKLTGLRRSSLFTARANLAKRRIVAHSETKDAEGRWTYELLNPGTGESFPGENGSVGPVTITEEWGNFILQGD